MPDAINMPVTLHPKQAEAFKLFRDVANREVTLRKGRRFGGTFLVGLATSEFAIANPMSPWMRGKPTEIGFFGPLYANAHRVYQEIVDSFKPALASYRESDLSLVWHGGARGRCYSGEKIGAALGSGLDIAEVDEASNFPGALIRSHIVPALTDRRGRLWQVSSPRHGKLNHFAQRCLRAESGEIPGVVGMHASSYDNPNLSREWLEAVRNDPDMDDLTFREEWLAEILDSSSSWLDPGKIQYIDSDKIPGNTYNTLHGDFAFADPEPGMVDQTTRRRKDANVLAPLSQDALGNTYLRLGGFYQKYADQDEVFDAAAKLIRDYSIVKFCFEREVNVSKTTTDSIGRLWNIYREKHNVPNVGLVRPQRHSHWKTPQIRAWSTLLKYGKFFIEQDKESGQTALLDGPLRTEMMEYSEAAAAKDRIHDDILVAVSDVMQPAIYQGRLEIDSMHRRAISDMYHLEDAWSAMKRGAWDNAAEPRKSQYGPI